MPRAWSLKVSATGLRLLGIPGEDERRGVFPLDDIDLAEFERRYTERAHGSTASFERFRRLWEGGACRRSLDLRARIAATEEVFPPGSTYGSGLLRLAVVWTLGEVSDFDTLSEGDAPLELLFDMGTTLLLFKLWRHLLARVSDRVRPMGLYVARIILPDDAGTIRRIFALPGVRGMEGVFLNSGGTIVPAKSRCAVVALGAAPTELPPPSACSFCGEKTCIYGQMGMCPHTFGTEKGQGGKA